MTKTKIKFEIKEEMESFIEAYGKSLDILNEIIEMQKNFMQFREDMSMREQLDYMKTVDKMGEINKVVEQKLEKLIEVNTIIKMIAE